MHTPLDIENNPNPVLLRLRGVSKSFGALRALNRVSLDLRAGQVHALLGENGAGKSTLMNIVAGLQRADAGEMWLDDQPYRPRQPRDAIEAGVGMVHQHFMLVPELSAVDNIILGDRRQGWRIRHPALQKQIQKLAHGQGFALNLRCPVAQLPVAEQQQVEILKVLWRGARVLIFDEPSAVLSLQQLNAFFASLRALAASGAAIALITHRLSEVQRFADRVSVLRHGRAVATDLAVAGYSQMELSRLVIAGAQVEPPGSAPSAQPSSPPLLDLDGLRDGDAQSGSLGPLDLKIYPGEILGLAGVSGNGQRALVDLILGLRRPSHAPSQGRVLLDGHDLSHLDLRARRLRGIGFIPADRLAQGVAPSRSVLANLSVQKILDQSSIWIRSVDLRERAQQMIAQHDIAVADLDQPVAELSGGNVQKLIVARELTTQVRLLIADQPCRGLDVRAAAAVRLRLVELVRQGGSVLLISQDLDEIMQISSRVAVLYRGRVVGLFPRAEFDLETIARLMLSGDAGYAS